MMDRSLDMDQKAKKREIPSKGSFYNTEKDKLFTWQTLVLSVSCTALNLGLSILVRHFNLPLYMNTMGGILAGALGGYLPGIMVGFFTHVIASFYDSSQLYYAVINIVVAIIAVILSKKGFFKNYLLSLVAAVIFAVVAGALNSCLSWQLYSGQIGKDVSAEIAMKIYQNRSVTPFGAQFLADLFVNLADKIVIMTLIFFILRALPHTFLNALPLGYLYLDKKFQSPSNELSDSAEQIR